jgi:hypothetical protein
MSKLLRIVLVFIGLAGLTVIGVQGAAWADKLGIGGPGPAAVAAVQGLPAAIGAQQVLPAAARPQGTVITVPPVVDIKPGQLAIVGNCATAFTASAPAGVTFTATVVDSTALPGPVPGTLLSCGLRIDARPASAALGAEIQVCFPIPPTKTAVASHHDLTQWVKTTQAVTNGQSCVAVPVSDPNPAFTALFEQ